MYIQRIATYLAFVLITLSAPLFAADEDILVIEVDGSTTGVIEIELLPDLAGSHVDRIKQLTRDGAYNDVVFHRVIDGFMAQTGDVKHGKREDFIQRYAGLGGSNYPDLRAEFSSEPFVRGVVGMARASDPNSANSQFFIMFGDGSFLNNQYTVFGKVTSGMDVVDAIKKGSKSANGAVSDPDYMSKVYIKSEKP